MEFEPPMPKKENQDAGEGSSRKEVMVERVGTKPESRLKRLGFPVFEKEDPMGWLCKAERYFWLNEIPNEEKVSMAGNCFEGKALDWLLIDPKLPRG